MGVSVDTIARALKGQLAKVFIRVEPRYRYDPHRKKKLRTSPVYHIAMDDPLLPDDAAAIHELLAKVDVAEPSPRSSISQIAVQASSRKMRQEEVSEELNNVNDKEKISVEEPSRRDYVAGELARKLDDESNIACYQLLANKQPEPLFFETLSVVSDIHRQGKIRKSRGALFMDLITRKASENWIHLGFGSRRDASLDDPQSSGHQRNGPMGDAAGVV